MSGTDKRAGAPVSPMPEPGQEMEHGSSPKVDEAYLRLLADFDNYKKRTAALLQEAEARGRDALVRDLASIVADLEKATQDESADAKALRHGVRMVLERLEQVLAKHGYHRIATVGHSLDPRKHDAVVAVSDRHREPGTILAEVSPGYIRSGRLVQPARVAVVEASRQAAATPGRDTKDGR